MHNIDKDKIKAFVLAGNATITLESGVTGKHFTYKIIVSKNDPNLYFIKLLRGEDNRNDYTYIGCYFSDNGYFNPEKKYQKQDVTGWPKSLRAIRYLFNHINNVPDCLRVYHEGKCCRCGRKLTTPESIRRGIGPECERFREQPSWWEALNE